MAEAIPGRVFTGTPDGDWTDLGRMDASAIDFEPQFPVADLEPVRWPTDMSVSITVPLRDVIGEKGYLVLGPAWLIWIAPDGRCFNGEGANIDAAMAAARRKWRGRPGPLAVNGHEYHRRQLARRRRRR